MVFFVFVDVVVQFKSFRSCFKFYLHVHVKLVFGYGNNDNDEFETKENKF